ncbi:cytochrome c oxidase subunit II [Phreatobacter sp.]|uniref:cytochrome c oxidase subunit II n=1 Tax=Phreatobacter sp. TaxID=1966341 RepID=UPI003F6FB538
MLLVLATAAFLIIFGLFLLALRRNRNRTVSLRLFLVWGGLVFPLVLLTVATVYGVVLGERITGARTIPAMAVEARAERWRWTFTHGTPQGSIVTENVLHVPAGQTVEIRLTSTDVIHSFWVPRLAGKIDAVPGMRNRILIRADQPGRYGGVCAEFCGNGHTGMIFVVVAHAAPDWDAIARGDSR